MWSYENHGECEGHRLIDNGMGYDPPTREQYVAMMRDHRASGVRPVWRFFRFHPEDRDLYAPLIAAAEDDAREHGGVEIEVEEDVREKRVCRVTDTRDGGTAQRPGDEPGRCCIVRGR